MTYLTPIDIRVCMCVYVCIAGQSFGSFKVLYQVHTFRTLLFSGALFKQHISKREGCQRKKKNWRQQLQQRWNAATSWVRTYSRIGVKASRVRNVCVAPQKMERSYYTSQGRSHAHYAIVQMWLYLCDLWNLY